MNSKMEELSISNTIIAKLHCQGMHLLTNLQDFYTENYNIPQNKEKPDLS